MSAEGGPGGEELLGPSRPLLPRRVRRAVVVLCSLVVAGGLGYALWPDHHQRRPPVVPPSSRAAPPAPSPAALRGWPSAPGSCDNSTDLPLVRGAMPVGHRTGISVVVGGTRLARIDFDTGRIAWLPKSAVRPDEYVARVAGGNALVFNCAGPDAGRPRVLRITGSRVVPLVPEHRIDDWLVDHRRVWGLRWASSAAGHDTLFPAGGGPAVPLPPHFAASGISDRVVVGNFASASGPGPLVLVDATTGKVRERLGTGQLLAVQDGTLVWATGCDVGTGQSCTAHRRAIDGGPVTDYDLPRSPSFTLGTISPDGSRLAFALSRALPDPRFRVDHPFPPADIAVLYLDSGTFDIVPGIELAPKASAALAFSRDDWLVIGLDAGTRTRLLAWRLGLQHPLEARALPGLAATPPGLEVLPGRQHRSMR